MILPSETKRCWVLRLSLSLLKQNGLCDVHFIIVLLLKAAAVSGLLSRLDVQNWKSYLIHFPHLLDIIYSLYAIKVLKNNNAVVNG